MNVKLSISAFLAGALFSVGLAVSGMTMPSKVVGFLNFFGAWDPSLMGVMGGGILVAFIVFRRLRVWEHPLFANAFEIPDRKDITPSLITGSAMFGVGWGLMGYCPGPAVTSIVTGKSDVLLFVVAMVAGMLLHRVVSPLWSADRKAFRTEQSVDA